MSDNKLENDFMAMSSAFTAAQTRIAELERYLALREAQLDKSLKQFDTAMSLATEAMQMYKGLLEKQGK